MLNSAFGTGLHTINTLDEDGRKEVTPIFEIIFATSCGTSSQKRSFSRHGDLADGHLSAVGGCMARLNRA